MSSSFELSDDTPVFVISVAATLAGMHPQTLRGYDRLGLVSPGRTTGRGRRYSARDIVALREVQRLSQDEGINLAGVKRILELERELEQARLMAAELHARGGACCEPSWSRPGRWPRGSRAAAVAAVDPAATSCRCAPPTR